MHGRLSTVRHDGTGLFVDVPQDFSVVRYHSLAITGPMGPEGRETAWADDGVVMGSQHRTRPLGMTLDRVAHTENRHWSAGRLSDCAETGERGCPLATDLPAKSQPHGGEWRRETGAPRPLGRRRGADRHLYERSRRRRAPSGSTAPMPRPGWRSAPLHHRRVLRALDVDAGENRGHRAGSHGRASRSSTSPQGRGATEPPPRRHRGLLGGYVGYLGYECKADCGS
jgi:para-aminobenzoate synthetase